MTGLVHGALWLTVLAPGDMSHSLNNFHNTPWGDVRVVGTAAATQVVILVGDDDEVMNTVAASLASSRTLVAQVHARAVLNPRRVSASEACRYPAARFEELAHYIEMSHGFAQYYRPTLVGLETGAALVFATLAQTPPNTFAGAVSVGFCPALRSPKPLCKGRGLRLSRSGSLSPALRMEEPWIAVQGSGDPLCPAGSLRPFIAAMDTAQLVEIAGMGHVPAAADALNWAPALAAVVERLREEGMPLPLPMATAVHDLPVVEVPATAGDAPLGAIIISGDGGWASIDREIADYFASHGVPVAGLSSLQYFWRARTADGAAHDLERLVNYYGSLWHKPAMLLMGFSLGADVLPFMASRLPPDVLERVQYMALLGPSQAASFEFHLTDWVGGPAADDARPVLPELQKLPCDRVMCIYASADGDSPCPQSCGNKVRIQGGHHFGGDYPALARRILEGALARSPQRTPSSATAPSPGAASPPTAATPAPALDPHGLAPPPSRAAPSNAAPAMQGPALPPTPAPPPLPPL